MTPFEQAESALATFKASMRDGHPWVPGGLFISNPGLDLYILAALQGWVEANRPDTCKCRCREGKHCGGCGHEGCNYQKDPVRRISLSDDPDWRPSSVAPVLHWARKSRSWLRGEW